MEKFYILMDQAGDGTGGSGGAGSPPPGSPPPASAWYDNFQDPGVKDWLKSYGDAYPNPEAVALKALNLEKFVGADKAGRGVIAPKSDAKPEEWTEFYKKIGGVPEKPDGYKMPESLANDPLMTKFRDHVHKSGIPPMFFDSIVSWYDAEAQAQQQAIIAEFERNADKDMADLKSEWAGPEYDKNVELGRRAARQFLPHENPEQLSELITKIEGAIGTKATMKMWAAIGAGVGEHEFIGGDGGGGMGGMSAEAARMRIQQLKSDPDFVANFSAGSANAKAEWEKLHRIGYPDQAA